MNERLVIPPLPKDDLLLRSVAPPEIMQIIAAKIMHIMHTIMHFMQ